ncbi:sodium:calcium antiporter [Nocardia sp. CDC159]|uniref:Sodium:calcium antiporter n=1 Tax=Nocardia pulmonis TaxID=2951408 RepID=A0A9X2EHU4_9NOCA|nr:MULTISPECIES: sodium:calcium antiporter [Nocardia]MCM6778953.1 sodium:calcium antiporter [Nocardia pulmonis]MCM6791842.1 sodium:calcium antiporter [Nocardia sp. CDC159]
MLTGLIVLPFAADHLVMGAARIAQRLQLTPAVVGVVIIGLGTSAPEFVVSGTAAATGNAGIATGNLIGSNILNVTLVLGVAAIWRGVAASSTVLNHEVAVSALAVALFALVIATGLHLWSGLLLAAAAALAITLLVRWARADHTNTAVAEQAIEFTAPADGTPHTETGVLRESLRTTAGLAAVLIAAQLLVTNTAAIATELGVSQLVIGATLVALGTSLPELVTAIQAQRRGETDLLIGNVFGSNLFNSLIGGGIVGIFTGTTRSIPVHVPTLLAMVATTALAWLLLRRDLRLTRPEAALLLLGYAATLPLLLVA